MTKNKPLLTPEQLERIKKTKTTLAKLDEFLYQLESIEYGWKLYQNDTVGQEIAVLVEIIDELLNRIRRNSNEEAKKLVEVAKEEVERLRQIVWEQEQNNDVTETNTLTNITRRNSDKQNNKKKQTTNSR